MNILVAEDERDMQKIITLYLKKEGYAVDVAADGYEAFEMLCHKQYDLLIADWMMPRMNGIKLCQEIRCYNIPLKIILLTAKGEMDDEITGLSCGADDYIRKPFSPQILLLRIKKMFQIENTLRCGALTYNQKSQMVSKSGAEVRLTQKESQLLNMLMNHKGQTVSRELLLDRVWGQDYDGDERTLDTHIRRLRGKIGKEYITTSVGIGYRMDEKNE